MPLRATFASWRRYEAMDGGAESDAGQELLAGFAWSDRFAVHPVQQAIESTAVAILECHELWGMRVFSTSMTPPQNYPIRECLETLADRPVAKAPEFTRRLAQAPFQDCMECGRKTLGQGPVYSDRVVLVCSHCGCTRVAMLPALAKKIVYLDQSVISAMMKAANPDTNAHRRGAIDPRWLDLFNVMSRLVRLQLVVCPHSEIHARESDYERNLVDRLRAMYKSLSSGVSFRGVQEIEYGQLQDYVEFWIEGEEGGEVPLRPSAAFNGDPHGWTPWPRIEAHLRLPDDLISGVKSGRDAGHSRFVEEVFNGWRVEDHLALDDWFVEEANAYGQFASTEIVDAVAWRIQVKTGMSETVARPRAQEFLRSAVVRAVPFNHIRALLYAAVAHGAAHGGQLKPPKPGDHDDISAVAHFLPYCDAIFVDRRMAGLMRHGPVKKKLARYSARVFSSANFEHFMQYLKGIEQEAPEAHLANVAYVYGERLDPPASKPGAQ